MKKNYKINYAVNAKKTSVALIQESFTVLQVLQKIQENEKDDGYQHLFYEGAEIKHEESFFDYYEPLVVYIATKEPEIPKELDIFTTAKADPKTNSDSEEDQPSIDEGDVIDFDIPEPDDVIPDLEDTGKHGFVPPEPEDVEPGPKKKKGFVPPEPEDVEPGPKKKKGFVPPEPEDVEPGPKKKKGFVTPEPPVVKPKSGKSYRVFTTLTLESMLKGHLVEGIEPKMKLNDVKNVVLKWVKSEKSFKGIYEDKSNIEVHLFLPCGIPFLSGTIYDWTSSLDAQSTKVLYAVVTRKLEDSAKEIYKHVCDCSNDEMKLLLSPICDSTDEGYTQIASLLGFFYYGGSLPTSENLLRNLATMTGFAPMINSIYTIMVQKKVNGLMIASITAALQTFISEKVTGSNLRTAFSYTNSLMSYVNNTKIKNLPVPNLIAYDYQDDADDKDLDDIQKYLKKNRHLNFIILWDKDLIPDDDKDVFKVSKLPNPVKVKQLNESFKSEMSLKPVSPMTILYLHSVSFIRTQKTKDDSITKVGLFIRKKPLKDKKGNILFIDPEKGGEPIEIDYEDLADEVGDHTIDDNIKNKGDTSLQQIIYVCLDTSLSMRNLLNGRSKKAKSKEQSRKELSVIFLKSLMKRIHDFMIPTARGLILFGKNIDVKCPLSISERNFDKAIEDIRPDGTTPLWAAIDQAADGIIKFNPKKTVDGETRYLYPKAKGRIILLSDADDTEAESKDIFKITEKLVKNGIVMDVIMISTAEECRDALVSAKITGGLSFRPQNKEEGIELFENEAFLDINARATYNPIYGDITQKIFNEQNRELGKNPYTKEIANKIIKKATLDSELSSVQYTLFYRKDERYQPKSICDRYIIKQLQRLNKNPNENIVVYTLQKELRKWRVFIKGPERSPYEDGWWHLYIIFPDNYPNSPPEFRFISVPYHQNVSGEGLLLFTKIADGYDPGHKMPDLLDSVRKVLKKPDDIYLLRASIAEEREKADAEYNRKAKASTAGKAKDDYHDYLKGIKVNEEIPEGGIVDDDDGEANESLFVTVTDKTREKARIIGDSDEDSNDLIDD